MAPIRILQVMPAMDAGGMETFVMNIYRRIDRAAVQFDFLCHYDKPFFFDAEIADLGGRMYKLAVRQDNNVPRYLRALDALFAAHPEYKILHGHYSGFGMFYNPRAAAHGVTVRAGHSHNTSYEKNLVGTLDRLMSRRFSAGVTDPFACSAAAGRMLFPGRNVTVVPNGIDTARFARPDPAARARLRAEWGVGEDALLLGHVGRFNAQKNHAGLLQIFAAVCERIPKARLVCIGTGPLEAETRTLAAQMGLGERVIFAGTRQDTDSCYRAMDAFLLPSLFEGVPVVLIEAQASGLPCFVADTVDREAAFGKKTWFLPLDDPEQWAARIAETDLTRDPDPAAAAVRAGYDIRFAADTLQAFYLRKAAEVGL